MERYFLCQQSIDEGGAAGGVRTKVVLMPAVFDEGNAAKGVQTKVVFMPLAL